jgi:hypothetical protein
MSEHEEFLINRQQIIDGLTRLGELALEHRLEVKLGVVGGAVMVLEYGMREVTHDVDVIILAPGNIWAATRRTVLELAEAVAAEKGWPGDWLNDKVDKVVDQILDAHIIFEAPGIEVYAPSTAQMLALKLSAWRGEIDIRDAAYLLNRMPGDSPEEVWKAIRSYIVPGNAAAAEGSFMDLWHDERGY